VSLGDDVRVILSSNMHPGRPSYATVELTWGLIIAAMRQIPQQMAALKAGKWQTGVGTGLRGRTLGIYGYGGIGAVVAGYGKAFGMKVLVWGRETSIANARADGHAGAASKQALFEESDVLTLHLRLIDHTRMPTPRRPHRLWDTYGFPGFRPSPTVRGIFGDPHARIPPLTRRGKKRPVGRVGGCSAAGTTASPVGSAIWPAGACASTWRSRSGAWRAGAAAR
jgi:hypothetical protein